MRHISIPGGHFTWRSKLPQHPSQIKPDHWTSCTDWLTHSTDHPFQSHTINQAHLLVFATYYFFLSYFFLLTTKSSSRRQCMARTIPPSSHHLQEALLPPKCLKCWSQLPVQGVWAKKVRVDAVLLADGHELHSLSLRLTPGQAAQGCFVPRRNLHSKRPTAVPGLRAELPGEIVGSISI